MILLPLLLAATPTFQTEPSFVRLGETVTASARFAIPGCELQGGQPQLAVNVGEFEGLHRVAQDEYAATYQPPKTRFPQVALVAVYCEGPPSAELEFFRIPLHGATRLPVTTRPGAEVTVEVGDATFGPLKADKNGKATFSIYVPPGVKQALVVGKDSKTGTLTQARVAVDVPAYNRLTLAAISRRLETHKDASTRVEAFYDGAPQSWTSEKLFADVSIGTLEKESENRGHVIFRYTPPRERREASAVISMSVEGDAASNATTTIALSEPPAELGRFAVGGRVGFNHALTEVAGARLALDAMMPFQVSGRNFIGSATLGYGGASQDVFTAQTGGGRGSVTFLPVSVRAGYEVQRGHRHWFHAGLGPAFAFARYTATFANRPDQDLALNGFGVGGTAFASGSVGLGPGHAFAELSYTFLPVNMDAFSVQTGGLFVSLGYRYRLLD